MSVDVSKRTPMSERAECARRLGPLPTARACDPRPTALADEVPRSVHQDGPRQALVHGAASTDTHTGVGAP
jgi:hypothetical protein